MFHCWFIPLLEQSLLIKSSNMYLHLHVIIFIIIALPIKQPTSSLKDDESKHSENLLWTQKFDFQLGAIAFCAGLRLCVCFTNIYEKNFLQKNGQFFLPKRSVCSIKLRIHWRICKYFLKYFFKIVMKAQDVYFFWNLYELFSIILIASSCLSKIPLAFITHYSYS